MLGDKILKFLLLSTFLSPGLLIFQFKHVLFAYERYKINKFFKKRDVEGEEVDCKYFYQTQGMLNEYYERPDMQIDSKYTLVYSVTFLYAFQGLIAVLPSTLLILVSLIVFALIDMKLIYSRYRKPSHESKNLGDHMIRRLIMFPKILTARFHDVTIRGTGIVKLIECFNLVIVFVLLVVDFNFLLKKLENFVERRFLASSERVEKRYSEHRKRFVIDYESEYTGVKNFES